LNILHIAQILWARRVLFLCVMFSLFAGAALIAWLWPNNYTATARVLVDLKQVDQLTGVSNVSVFAQTQLATQADVVRSSRVALKAVKLLGLEQSQAARERFEKAEDSRGSFDLYWSELLLRYLEVKPVRESTVLDISFTGPNAAFAAEVANAFARSYLQTSLELRVEPAKDQSQWFDARIATFREDLVKAQQRLTDYQKKNGIVSIDERLDVENARLQELSTALVNVQGQSVDSTTRSTSAESALKDGTGGNLPEVLNSPSVQLLRTELVRAQARVAELSQRLGPSHPQMVASQSEVEALQKRLQSETAVAARSITQTSNVNVKREAELRNSLAQQKTKVLQLKRQRDEMSALQREVESAQRSYDQVRQRLVQTTLESQASNASVSLLDSASAPSQSSSLKSYVFLLIALFWAPLIAAVACLVWESLDRRLRTPEDIERILGPSITLAEVPKLKRLGGAYMRAPLQLSKG
jgi:polysaccharide biosynthesis transport protein